MILGPEITKRKLRLSHELATPYYRLFLGSHIHHGLWNAAESRAEAQVNLMQAVIQEAQLRGGERVLDVGCGIGTSAIYLSKARNCHVTGVTISRVQQLWATFAAIFNGAAHRTRFLAADAETVALAPASFDLVWIVECAEYLFDKAGFVQRLSGWLRPGGRAVFCAWETGDEPLSAEARRNVYEVCAGFGYPSLCSGPEYREWFTQAGLAVERSSDWTSRVSKSWEISWRDAQLSRLHWLARLVGRDRLLFWDHFRAMLIAYQTGAMKYECWTLRKDEGRRSAVAG